MDNVRKDHWWDHMVQILCPSRISLENITWGYVQTAFVYLPWERLQNSWKSVPILRHSRSTIPPYIQVDLAVHQILPVASHPNAWSQQGEPGSILLTTPFRYTSTDTLMKYPLSLLLAEQAQFTPPTLVREMLQSPDHPCSLPWPSCTAEPRLEPVLQTWQQQIWL